MATIRTSSGRRSVSPAAVSVSLVDLAGNADVVEIAVGQGAPIAGRLLQEPGETELLTPDVLVVTIERDDRAITPKDKTTIETGDFVTVLSRTGLSDDILAVFTGA